MTGGGITPDRVSVRVLSEVLEAVRQLAYLINDERDAKLEDTHNSLHLIGKITRGSAVYRLSASHPDRAAAGLRLVGSIVSDPLLAEHHPNVLRPTEDISKIARALRCHVEIYDNSDAQTPLARIGPETYSELAATALVHGRSSIRGTVIRVGGATKYSCALRVPSQPQRLVICKLANQTLARDLAQSLFQKITATGEATWFRRTWKLHSFVIQALQDDIGDDEVADPITALRTAGGSQWDNIKDPDKYLSDLRGDAHE